MSTTNFLVRRLSRQNDEYKKQMKKETESNITKVECDQLSSKLSTIDRLPKACGMFKDLNQKEQTKDVGLKRRLTYVAMHDYPPTAC